MPETLHNLVELVEAWAHDRNIIAGLTPTQQLPKLVEELGELAGALIRNNDPVIKDSIGDMLVVLTIMSAQKGWSLRDCLEVSWHEIKDRKGIVRDGIFVKEADL